MVVLHAGTAALFMFTDGFKRIHELMVFDEDNHRSWFIGSTVLAGWCLSCQTFLGTDYSNLITTNTVYYLLSCHARVLRLAGLW